MKRMYLEMVVNEFYAYYGGSISNGELYIRSLEHTHFVLNGGFYLVLKTGIMKFPLVNQHKIQVQIGRIETLLPTQILNLATSAKLTPNGSHQLKQLAYRLEHRLTEVTVDGLTFISRRLEYISNGEESVNQINSYVTSFWHATFKPEPDDGDEYWA